VNSDNLNKQSVIFSFLIWQAIKFIHNVGVSFLLFISDFSEYPTLINPALLPSKKKLLRIDAGIFPNRPDSPMN